MLSPYEVCVTVCPRTHSVLCRGRRWLELANGVQRYLECLWFSWLVADGLLPSLELLSKSISYGFVFRFIDEVF